MSSSESSGDEAGNAERPDRNASDKEGSSSDSAPSHRSPSQDKSDNNSGDEAPPRKRRNIIDSDDDVKEEDDDSQEQETTAATNNLFGNDSSDDSEGEIEEPPSERRVSQAEEEQPDSDADSRKSDGSIQGIRMHNPDEELEEEKKEEITNIEMELLYTKASLADDSYAVKMPNFLSVATHPFDPETYDEDEYDDELKTDDEGRNRLKLRVENTIRWRTSKLPDSAQSIESNAKFVKWSDGTMSLYLGNEIFEVNTMALTGAPPHIFIRHHGSTLAAQTMMENRLTFRPHSTDSKTHRKVTLNMADRSRKSGQMKVMDEVRANPDVARKEAVRREEEALRAAVRRDAQVRKAYRPRPISSNFLERDEDDQFGGKSRGKYKRDVPLIGHSSDESDDDAAAGGRKSRVDDEEVSDDDFNKKQQKKKRMVVTSDEEDEGGAASDKSP